MRYFGSHFVFAYILNCSTLRKFQFSVWSSAMPKETESIKKNVIPQNEVQFSGCRTISRNIEFARQRRYVGACLKCSIGDCMIYLGNGGFRWKIWHLFGKCRIFWKSFFVIQPKRILYIFIIQLIITFLLDFIINWLDLCSLEFVPSYVIYILIRYWMVPSVCDSVCSLQKPLSRCPISKPSTYLESSWNGSQF